MGTVEPDFQMNTLIYTLVLLVTTLLCQANAKGQPVVTCSNWARQSTDRVGPDTVATLLSDVDKIRRCTTIFKLKTGCAEMRLSCTKFNVPEGQAVSSLPELWDLRIEDSITMEI